MASLTSAVTCETVNGPSTTARARPSTGARIKLGSKGCRAIAVYHPYPNDFAKAQCDPVARSNSLGRAFLPTHGLATPDRATLAQERNASDLYNYACGPAFDKPRGRRPIRARPSRVIRPRDRMSRDDHMSYHFKESNTTMQ